MTMPEYTPDQLRQQLSLVPATSVLGIGAVLLAAGGTLIALRKQRRS